MKNILNLRRSILGAVLLGSALALSAAPHADGVAVHYNDVDLSSDKALRCSMSGFLAPQSACAGRQVARICARCDCIKPVTRAPWRMRCNNVNANTLTALHRIRTQKTVSG